MTRRAALLHLGFWIAGTVALPAQPPAKLSADKVAAIERRVTEEMSRQNIPGMTIAIAWGDASRWTAGYGLADLENYVPAKGSTRIRLASISKSITAIGAMQLVEQGRLKLDDPVQKHVPEYPYANVTVRQLLTHTSGTRHYDEARNDVGSTRHFGTLTEALSMFMRDPLLYDPGTRYAYSTYGYVLLGVVMERASGMAYVDYIRKNVLEPSGAETLVPDHTFHLIPNRSRGYHKNGSGVVENAGLADTSYKIPGGGWIGTSEDLVKIAIALNQGKLLKRESIQEMWTRARLNNGDEVGYGLGWVLEQLDGKQMVGHNGGQQGASTSLRLLPKESIAVAVMFNLDGAGPDSLVKDVLRIVLQ